MNNSKNKGRAPLRWPKGHPQAGKFAPKNAFDEIKSFLKRQAKIQREQKRAAKLAHDREVRRAQRERRSALMAKPDAVTSKRELIGEIHGWGNTSVGRLREGTRYRWHGVYRIQGSASALHKVLREAGSDAKLKLLSTADGRHELIITPYFGAYTPAQAENALPDHAATELAKYERMGVTVDYLGAFHSPLKRGK